MRVAVLSASPKQQFSLTLQTVRTLQKMCKDDEFDISFIKDANDHSEFEEKAKSADLVLILSSLYHFNTHGQLMRFLKGIEIPEGKPITYITTSGLNMDVPAHNYIRSFARQNKLKWVRSLSLMDEDVLQEYRREELYRWFCYVKDVVNDTKLDGESLKDLKVCILDCGDEPNETEETAKSLVKRYEALGANVNYINMREKTLKGCIACFACYTNNKCIIKDDFLEIDQQVEAAELLVVVSGINYNQFSTNYKYYLDRHVQYGRYAKNLEMTRAYVYCGEMDPADAIELEQHTLTVDSLDGDVHVGIYPGTAEGIESLMKETTYACVNDIFPQRNSYSVGLNMQFANLAYRLQNMTTNDYNYFKSKGYYEMPKIIKEVKPIGGLEEGRMSCKMRLIAFEEMLSKVDGPPKMTKRGERTQYFNMIGADVSVGKNKNASSDGEKKGFSLFRKK